MSALDSVAVERGRPRTVLVAVAVLVALVANLVVCTVGRLAGGSYRFTAPTRASAGGGSGPVVNESVLALLQLRRLHPHRPA